MKRMSLCVALMLSLNANADDHLEEVLVTAHPLSEGGVSQSIKVLEGDALNIELQDSLGATVANQPGVRSASFGAAVGRPVIHGLSGARVKTTEDRIDSLDVSVTSNDHAVTVEPFIANSVSILKGPSTLLYGSAAIGGVVDVETGRIPRALPEQPISGKVELRRSDNADAETTAIRLDGGSGQIAWHLDAFSKKADDYDIPGFVESASQRALEEAEEEEHSHEEEEEGHEDEHGHEGEEERDVLEGSGFDNEGGAFGLSWVTERGFIGASISKTESNYGLVGGHGHHEEEEGHGEEEGHDDEHEEEEGHEDEHGEEEEEAPGMLDLEQTRFDLEAQLNNPFAGIEKLNFRFGLNDYEHTEIEGNGEVGTVFDNEAWEGRLELTHKPIAEFGGVLGIQLSDREFSALGEEAFVPPAETKSASLFWVGERKFTGFDLEAGIRFEDVEHTRVETNQTFDFSVSSASLGAVIPLNEALTLSALLDYTSRAPTIEELFSNGPHLATQTFEIGDTNLDEESVLGLSLTLNYDSDLVDLYFTAYHMSFDQFIYQANTGLEEDELPVFVYQQEDATFTGLDFEAGFHLFKLGEGDLDITGQFDTVKAELDISGNDNLPRIPATRYGLSLKWASNAWLAKLSYLRVQEQNDVADFELPTEAYDDVSLDINRKFLLGDNEVNVFLQGRNLSDDEQRHHVSFVKDVAPAPGRRWTAGIRYQF